MYVKEKQTLDNTYRGNSSNDLTECSGELGLFLCTSTSFLFWTSLFLRTLIKSEASATAAAEFSIGDETHCSLLQLILQIIEFFSVNIIYTNVKVT